MDAKETYPIKGVPLPNPSPPDGSVPLRREVNEWFRSKVERDVIQVKLFLLALIDFENLPVETQLSYFQVAGIHGYPQKDWDGVPKPPINKDPNNLQGYCTHNSQRLYELMEGVIAKHTAGASFEIKTAWQEAANLWRLPYWDWASKRTTRFPDIAREEKIEIETPAYPSEPSYDNPLFKFTMPKGQKMGDHGVPPLMGEKIPIPYQLCKGTSRWPKAVIGPKWVAGDVDNDAVRRALTNAAWPPELKIPAMTISDAVYRLFTEDWFKRYEAFATTHFFKLEKENDPEPTHYLSLEGIHNQIHNWTGGKTLEGHMTEVPVAAFDPLFWLHHCNVDRLYAIWQDLHEELWWDENSPLKCDGLPTTFLKPFHDNRASGEWNSNKARYWRNDCGYSYPELQPWLPEYYKDGSFDRELYMLGISAQINDLYSTTREFAINPPEGMQSPAPIDGDIVEQSDYIFFASYEKFALNGAPFTIHVLLGSEPQASTDPATYSHEIGIIYNFSSTLHVEDDSEGCANCVAQANERAQATGLLPLTPALLSLSDGQDSPFDFGDDAQTEEWLKNNLRWKVTTVGGSEVPLPSLKVGVARGSGKHSREDASLSAFFGYKVLHEITDRKD